MRAGRLDRRITLQVLRTTRGPSGSVNERYVTLATVWAQFIPDRGAEISRANDAQRQAQATGTFRIRWRPDLDRTLRVLWDGAEWDVTDVIELGRRAGADLRATASVA